MSKRTRAVVIVLGLVMAIAIVYCHRPPNAPVNLAVVDLDQIAENTGQKVQIEKAREMYDWNLWNSARVLRKDVQDKLTKLIEAGGFPTVTIPKDQFPDRPPISRNMIRF